MGAAAGGPQYLQGGGINQPQVNYTPPQAIPPQSPAEKTGYYTEKAAEIAAPVTGGALRWPGRCPPPKRPGRYSSRLTPPSARIR